MKLTKKLKKSLSRWWKKTKIRLTNSLYLLIGTRVKVEDIVEDLPTVGDVWTEFCILMTIWEHTRFKNDKLSMNRLEACVRAFLKFKGRPWKDIPKESFNSTLELIYGECIDLYDDTLYTEKGLELQCVAKGATGDVLTFTLLLEYLFRKEIE